MPSGSRGAARAFTFARCVVIALATLTGLPLKHAWADALPIGRNALPGAAHVASARQAPRLVALSNASYGHTEQVAGSPAVHERIEADVSAAFSPAPAWMFGITGFARVDTHRANGARKDAGAAFGSELAGRYRHELSRALSLAGEIALVFPPANGVGRGLKSTSPALRAVGSYAWPNDLNLSFNAGFRLDRTRFAVSDPNRLSANDRIAAGLSDSNALLFGAMASVPYAGFVFTGEWSWDLAVGGGAPSGFASPMRIEAGVQRRVLGKLFAGGRFGVSPSTRPAASDLARIEPRVWLALSVGILLDEAGTLAPEPPKVVAPPPPPEPKVEEAPPPAPAEPALPPGQIRGRVRSLRGGALRAQVEVLPLGQTFETDAKGAFVIDVPPGRYTVVVRAEGHESQERPAEVEQDGVTILVIDLRRDKR